MYADNDNGETFLLEVLIRTLAIVLGGLVLAYRGQLLKAIHFLGRWAKCSEQRAACWARLKIGQSCEIGQALCLWLARRFDDWRRLL